MKLAIFLFALISPFAHAYIGPTNLGLDAQIYLKGVTISKVVCLPDASSIRLNDHGTKTDYEVTYSECLKISENPNFVQASVCGQLDADMVVEVTDSIAGTIQNKHISEIRSLAIVQRACQ